MVWRVQIDTVPARWECHLHTDSSRAIVIWETCSVILSARSTAEGLEVCAFETAVADTAGLALCATESRVSCEHAETLANRQSRIFQASFWLMN